MKKATTIALAMKRPRCVDVCLAPTASSRQMMDPNPVTPKQCADGFNNKSEFGENPPRGASFHFQCDFSGAAVSID